MCLLADSAAVLAVVLAVCTISMEGWAQSDQATIRGTVQTQAGHPVSEATVMARNLRSGQHWTVQSNPQGQFEIGQLSPGTYALQVTQARFVSQAKDELELDPGTVLTLNFALESSSVSGVKNPAAQEALSTARPGVSRISEAQLVGLPLNGRSYSQLATLQAGVTDPTAASGSRGVGGGGLNVLGSRSSSNSFLLDGTNIMDTENQVPRSAAGVQLGSDAVMQVQVFSANYGAEYGRGSGGVLNSITRAGSSEFHGSLFEFFRNSKLDARNFFDEAEPPPFKRNQFGFTLTGPLKKDRTFFMGSFEAMRDRLTETKIDRWPDANARQGLLPDPDNPGALKQVGVHPGVKPLLDHLYPIPTGAQLRGGIRELAAVQFSPTNENYFTVRVDHSLSDRDSFFARYTFDDATSHSPQASALFKTETNSRQQYLTLVESHIFSLNGVNSFRFGYTRPVSFASNLSTLEIPPSLYFFPGASYLGDISVPGLSTMGPSSPVPTKDLMNSFQFEDDVIVQKGPHSLKFGVQVHRYRWDTNISAETRGQWNFSSLESFLQGGPAGTNAKVALPGSDARRAYRQTLLGFYAQDTYNAGAALQLNLGLRYEFATLLREKDGKTTFLPDPFRDTEIQVGRILKGNPSLRALAPRIGITWSPGGSPNTVLSGGVGLYYDQVLGYFMSHRDGAAPFFKRAVKTNFDATPFFPNPIPATAEVNSFEARVFDFSNTAIPRVLRYTFSVQRFLPGNWRVQATYVGARGNHVLRGFESNLYPFPITREDGSLFFPDGAGPMNPAFPSGIKISKTDAQTFYNALQLSAAKSLSHGLSLQGNYTFSKSIDDGSVPWSDPSAYGHIRSLGRSLSDFDIRHRLVLSYFYTLPLGGGQRWWKSGVLSNLLSGWRLGGIASFRTGTPFSAEINVRNPGFLFADTRPNLVARQSNNPTSGSSMGCDAVSAGQELRAPERYFDPCVFQVPDPGTLGNVGRNTIIAPSVFNMDLSLQREFLIDAKRRLQFRAEFFNLPNHANFSKPSSGIFTGRFPGRPNPTAGRISETITTSRQIQFALRFSF
ncbi:MAG: TonB-dependent receptor [Acidobacteria bacterium]|nr:TonB-dependent receptor [Acidobacteriota bacterium]